MSSQPKSTPKNQSKPSYYYAIGRRKRAMARVRLYPHSGSEKPTITINDKPAQTYFRLPDAERVYLKPLKLTQATDRFKITIKVLGSGLKGQMTAISHGLSRALVKVNEDYKPILKTAGLLTRDPRSRQRRMIGTGGKSRRQKQSPKR